MSLLMRAMRTPWETPEMPPKLCAIGSGRACELGAGSGEERLLVEQFDVAGVDRVEQRGRPAEGVGPLVVDVMVELDGASAGEGLGEGGLIAGGGR